MAQRLKNPTSIHEDAGLAEWVKDPAWLWLWYRPVATAPTGPLAWEPPYAAGTALKRTKKKKNCAPGICWHLPVTVGAKPWKQKTQTSRLGDSYLLQSGYFCFHFLRFWWSRADVRGCDHLCCPTKRFSYACTHIRSFSRFVSPHRPSQNTGESSLC